MPKALAGRDALCACLLAFLLASAGCGGKKKTAAAPAPEPTSPAAVKASSPSTDPPSEEAKPGLLARLNPFHKRKTPPPESEPAKPAPEEPEAAAKVKRKRGFFGRWFGGPKELPKARPTDLKRRRAVTAKGEVSPPPFVHNGLELTIGETTKARIVAAFGKPEHVFFSEGSEELLIYRRIRKIDSLYIFFDSQGVVKDYIITKKQ